MQKSNIETCTNIVDVRRNIDSIDKELVALIAKRGAYVKQAAQFKATTAEVEAPKRVDQVIEKVTSIALAEGANICVIEAVWRSMISAFIEAEKEEFAKITST
ncbi:chorismate mutase [Polynucleobacter sp. AP-Sving-400A-A2]|uniref:chorismate mutase n=1 Tax=Polynucleobacter sp. AP-Sving-400A-A2 TaxID=2081049 RepID=UPI001BFE244F|nr:chorismate mutase [Polynucleobacter sp. AP-Sving-400A-A2]QWE15258.1 chorismate mutase [Polynucleobacter sp. AP-Sving-400A-A2]